MNLAIVVKGYPRLSETFIAQELVELERRGFTFRIVSLRHPTDPDTHQINRAVCADVSYLPEYLYREPLRVARAALTCMRLPGLRAALSTFAADLRRDRTANRIRRFGQALVLAAENPGIAHFHVHFLHTPASVARYASQMLGTTWSCSAHAKDIWTTPEWELREKLDSVDFVVTCTRVNLDRLRSLARQPGKIKLAYHGLDLDRFPRFRRRRHIRDGSRAAEPVRLLTVGRAVPKKGLDVGLRALSKLPRDFYWRWSHIGGGIELDALKSLARDLGIDDRLSWLGPQEAGAVLEAYRDSDIFILPSVIGPGGDRDGLPNVLMEAQSQELACISSRLSGIPEIIEHGHSGILVEPGDADALRDAILNLGRAPARRAVLCTNAYPRLVTEFSIDSGIDVVQTALRRSMTCPTGNNLS